MTGEGLLQTLCHEFRTPVASLQALAGALSREPVSLTVEERLEALRLIEDHARHLGAMLDAARRVAGHLPEALPGVVDRREVDLVRLAAGAASAAGLPAQRLRLDVAVDATRVLLDAPKVRQVLTNLFENADRHAGGRQPVTLCARRDGDAIVLLVVDAGPGLPPDVAARMSELTDEPPVGTAQDGSRHGLGLWIVTQLVALLGGSIRVAADGKGTQVQITLPAA